VHISAVERAGLSGLNEGQKVKFDTAPGKRPGQINAMNIQTV
jgi:CspA family cold shock protein